MTSSHYISNFLVFIMYYVSSILFIVNAFLPLYEKTKLLEKTLVRYGTLKPIIKTLFSIDII